MQSKHALILAFLITGLIASNYFLFQFLSAQQKLETAIVARVIDADTIELEDGRTLRLLNINAPESTFPNSALSTQFLKPYENSSIKFQITEKDKYNRNLAKIYSLDNSYINLELVKQGFASTFLVSENELKNFKQAEENAISQGKGIWKHSEYYNCLASTIEKEEEYIILTALCDTLDLELWKLKDESRKIFTFPNIKLNKDEKLILYSREGVNNVFELYWNQKTNVWNNNRDTIYVFDSNGFIVHFNSYGY
mgnify:CR=1 FL=1